MEAVTTRDRDGLGSAYLIRAWRVLLSSSNRGETMTDDAPETEAQDDPVAVDPPVEAEAPPEAEGEAEAPAEADAEERQMDPAVQEHIGQETTRVLSRGGEDHGVPSDFRTPPGIPSGLDPGTLSDRDPGPDTPNV
jgi:hypothetical protein